MNGKNAPIAKISGQQRLIYLKVSASWIVSGLSEFSESSVDALARRDKSRQFL
jgi:hypothetical protein